MEDTGVSTVARAAGFWRRLVGMLIDSLLLGIVGAFLSLAHVPGFSSGGPFWGSEGGDLSLLLALAYFTFFHGRTGQTPGNAALGIRVVDLDSGRGGIGYGRAALRWLVSIASALLLLVGYLWMLWDANRQTWHDKAARSLPVNA